MSDTAERGLAEPGSAEPGQAVPKERKGLARWADWLVIAVPAVTAFVVGGYQIGGPSLWRDEAYTRDAITRPVGKIFALLAHTDAVHGAYYLLLHVVVGLIGTSATALRFPSLCAMVVAAAFTAAIGRRAAMLAQAPNAAGGRRALVPALTGLLSGLVFATAPFMTYYAQTARSYAIVTMFATIASYLLLRAYPGGGWRWWSAYAVAVALTGLFNVFGLLILVAHGVTLLLTASAPAPTPAPAPVGAVRPRSRFGRLPVGWLAASAAAVVVLAPFLRVTYSQRGQISWLTRPDFETIASLCRDFAGSTDLIAVFGLLALGGVTASCLADGWRPLNPAAIALPWLVVPPFLLIAVSFADPVYDERYVEFCLPALAILVASGLVGLVRLASRPRLRRTGRPARAWLPSAGRAWLPSAGRAWLPSAGRAWLPSAGRAWLPSAGRAWLPSAGRAWLPLAAAAVVALGIALLLVGPQGAIRQSSQRPDNLRLASAIVAANERPGDVVFYLPLNARVIGTGYPAPFRKLRDIAAARSAVASNTLAGTEISSPALLASRFTDVQRVWVVSGQSNGKFPVPYTRVDKEKLALLANAGLRALHRWRAGEVLLTLYGR